MSSEIKTMGEIYKEINHMALKAIGGGVYIGVSLGILFVFYYLNRYHLEFKMIEFVWILGVCILSFIFGLILIQKSGIQIRIIDEK